MSACQEHVLYSDFSRYRKPVYTSALIQWSMKSWVRYAGNSLRSSCSPPPSPIYDEDHEPLPPAVRNLPDFPEFPANWDSMWMNTSIYDWTERDVIAWIIYVLQKENLTLDMIDLTKFKCSGEDLLRMSKKDFKERCPEYGQKLYEAWFCKKAEVYTTQFEERRKEMRSVALTSEKPESSSSHSGSESEDSVADIPDINYWKPRKRAGGHSRLWPFLRDLLKSGKNKDVIEWIHRGKGIFKIKDTKKLAELWGEVRNNPNMNYEKMYSSLRYNYKSGYLKRVPWQKLIFGFGPYAKGWKLYKDSSVESENRT
ncbi:ETS-related transcription factor Elf-5 isoform X2 [Anabrus simplex]|uniref:ETS-related transcription factor Elf-5 isoform X2 n=1 Tax=Anabrus simplex TaxID=316456 RepID=UPI0035A28373